jgi:lysozyme family protein
MTDLKMLSLTNGKRWSTCSVHSDVMPIGARVASHLIAGQARYLTVANTTGVPWYIIAVIHQRESSQSWSASLAQGDPWNAESIHVPKHRGPFASWEAAAIDALDVCPPHASHWPDWSAGGALCLLEQYNGLGYANRALPSPYIWAGTDQYHAGKYVSDGHFDPSAIDHQLGCAVLLKCMESQGIKIF